jgi:hypothetical protein
MKKFLPCLVAVVAAGVQLLNCANLRAQTDLMDQDYSGTVNLCSLNMNYHQHVFLPSFLSTLSTRE